MNLWKEALLLSYSIFPGTPYFVPRFCIFLCFFDVNLVFVLAVVPCLDLFPYSISAFFRECVQRKSMIPVKKSNYTVKKFSSLKVYPTVIAEIIHENDVFLKKSVAMLFLSL